ncbi:MAG: UvrD-helicase domain-containing protein [Planctomycetes bacterium]|nr:UvrD-helicase domain-containing protein [Planctomycetota bacterium]
MNATTTIQLTSEQQAALAGHARSVSLSAGAGCGKTFVLTQRFLSYLDPRVLEPSAELHELVAITFTDAAAREMRERIRRRCYERFTCATDAGERQAWNRLIRSLDSARISTIHSFCATLLRNHAAEAGVDPRFEQLDPAAADLLRLQTVDDHLRQLLLAGDERVIQLATRFGLGDLRDHVVRLLGENPAAVISKWAEKTPEELVNTWRDFFSEVVVPAAMSAILDSESVNQLQEICETAQVSKPSLQEHFVEILDVLARLPDCESTHTLLGVVSKREPNALASGELTETAAARTPEASADGSHHTTINVLRQSLEQLIKLARVQGVCTKKDWDDPEQYSRFKSLAATVRELLKKSALLYSLEDDPMHEAASTGHDLLCLVAEVARAYDQVKQERNVLEFDDLLLRAFRLLTDSRYPAIRENLNRGTRLLLVDEFQDTDPLQVAIVKAFCGDDWAEQGLFVVGDFKQSIYRFRGAEPRVSSELRATLPVESRLSLTTSFRSTPAILDFVNALFCSAFKDPYEPLQPSRPQLTSTPSVEFLWATKESEQDNDEYARRLGGKQQSRVHEARFIARRLAQLLDTGDPIVADGAKGIRPLQLGDIAILMRSLSDVALYEEALREQGLDYYLAGGHAFYAQQEIYDLLHLLRAIASPADELSLAGVLRSPIFALEDETLFWLVQSQGSLNAGLFSESLSQSLSQEESDKVARAAAILGDLRARKDQLLVAELLNEALEQTGYDAMLLCEFLGRRKMANVLKLVEQARALDRTSPGDLNGFITQLSEFVVRMPKEALAATQSEGDVICIMTIHGAKGLEFPLVVVPDLNRGGHSEKRQPVFDEQLGPLVPAAQKSDCVGLDLYRFCRARARRRREKAFALCRLHSGGRLPSSFQ